MSEKAQRCWMHAIIEERDARVLAGKGGRFGVDTIQRLFAEAKAQNDYQKYPSAAHLFWHKLQQFSDENRRRAQREAEAQQRAQENLERLERARQQKIAIGTDPFTVPPTPDYLAYYLRHLTTQGEIDSLVAHYGEPELRRTLAEECDFDPECTASRWTDYGPSFRDRLQARRSGKPLPKGFDPDTILGCEANEPERVETDFEWARALEAVINGTLRGEI